MGPRLWAAELLAQTISGQLCNRLLHNCRATARASWPRGLSGLNLRLVAGHVQELPFGPYSDVLFLAP